ncbi:MAG TPA: 3-methyl-2-oxobutanoate hydroxymethyltransferase [Nitrososphaerales archaeon]
MKGKINISEIRNIKQSGKKITCITSYDYVTASLAEKANIDLILVGDSASMVVLGYETTIPITVEEMIIFTKAVTRGNKKALIVGDMPFMSYQASDEDAVRNAGRFVKEGGVDAVKIEGGIRMKSRGEAMIRAGIPVMGHIGLTPQTSTLWSGYRVQGKTIDDGEVLLRDAKALEEAGVFAIVLEMITSEVAKMITDNVGIPTIGIGSGPLCDGQIVVLHDILGLYDKFSPKFIKKYANMSEIILKALESYRDDVTNGNFPGEEHTFHMTEYDSKSKIVKKSEDK